MFKSLISLKIYLLVHLFFWFLAHQFGVSKFDKSKLKTVKTAEKIILATAVDIKQAKKDETG